MNYYERHLGDYAKDTGHLAMLEHGAYSMLLDRYYSTESGIPEDQAHRVARARTRDERAAVDAVLAEFFVLTDGVWINGRTEEEIAKARGRIGAAKANGRRGGRPKKNPAVTPEEPTGLSLGSDLETQTKALHTPYSILHTKEKEDAAKPPSSEKFYFDYGKAVLGDGTGGLLARARTKLGEPNALKLLREAAEKHSPREYFAAAVVKKQDATDRGQADETLENWRSGQSWN